MILKVILEMKKILSLIPMGVDGKDQEKSKKVWAVCVLHLFVLY